MTDAPLVGELSIRPVTAENWRSTLGLRVQPDQLGFIADYEPVALVLLAKGYVQPGGMHWLPYVISEAGTPIGMIELAIEPGSHDGYWIYHFFIDAGSQGKGLGRAAMVAFIELIRGENPHCQRINLTVHPENLPAQSLYTSLGFKPMGEVRDGEPAYVLQLPPGR